MKTNLLKWMMVAACFTGTVATAQDFAEVHVWHSLGGAAEQAFVEAVDAYQGNSGNEVVVSQFSSQQELYQALQVARHSGTLPDVLLGNHTMAPELLEDGLINAYCLPGECPECESGNPPRWCAYASNGYYGDYEGSFEATMIPELEMSPERCLMDDCGECQQSDIARPQYCDYVANSGGARLDMIQASFAMWHPDWRWPFPFGVPWWWEYLSVGFDRDRLDMHGLEVPTNISMAQELLSINQAGYLWDYDGEWCGTPPRRIKVPGWVNEVMGSSPDPIPASEADLFVVPSSQLASLVSEVPGLQVATLEDHRPEIIVDGAFVLSTTQNRSASLDFAYELANPDFQLQSIDGTSLLPAHGQAFGATEGLVPGLRDAALTGALAPTYTQAQ
ncbi:hypothetical protein [Myxococcus sp. Y35]|uniref:hypothetical protein n=1 Tax=Pseudomyxococcus flavus TaxID=3115648 RepID=UPI003CFAC223